MMGIHRISISLREPDARRIAELAYEKRLSKAALIASAVEQFLSSLNGDQSRSMMSDRRLDRLSSQLERLERDQTILIETVALFIRHYLATTLPIPESELEIVRVQGKVRFEHFIDQLARNLTPEKRLMKDIYAELEADVEPIQDAPAEKPDESSNAQQELSLEQSSGTAS